MKRLIIVCSGLLLIVGGCSYLSSTGGHSEEPHYGQSSSGYMKPDSATAGNLAFDPMSLGPSVFASYTSSGNTGSSKVSDYAQPTGTGYRVQLGAFIDQSLADKLATRAENELGVQSYVVFDRPFYRVRVGDFKQLSEAEMLKSTAISKGYQDARIARDVIQSGDQ